MKTGSFVWSAIFAIFVLLLRFLLEFSLIRQLIRPWLPAEGSGPSVEERKRGWYRVDLIGSTSPSCHKVRQIRGAVFDLPGS